MDGYRQLAQALIDYIDNCNRRMVVPLRWDVNVYTSRLHEIEKREGGKR